MYLIYNSAPTKIKITRSSIRKSSHLHRQMRLLLHRLLRKSHSLPHWKCLYHDRYHWKKLLFFSPISLLPYAQKQRTILHQSRHHQTFHQRWSHPNHYLLHLHRLHLHHLHITLHPPNPISCIPHNPLRSHLPSSSLGLHVILLKRCQHNPHVLLPIIRPKEKRSQMPESPG